MKSPSSQRGRDFGVMLSTLNELGYNVEWRVINAADYGNAQRRRSFIFGYKQDLNYADLIDKYSLEDIVYNSGMFAKAFLLKKNLIKIE